MEQNYRLLSLTLANGKRVNFPRRLVKMIPLSMYSALLVEQNPSTGVALKPSFSGKPIPVKSIEYELSVWNGSRQIVDRFRHPTKTGIWLVPSSSGARLSAGNKRLFVFRTLSEIFDKTKWNGYGKLKAVQFIA